VDYTNLTNLSLYIYPEGVKKLSSEVIGTVNPKDYTTTDGGEYYNTKNIYYHVGYWNEEFYRLGIVYILNDNTKTPVFNILGGNL
jgi:hypothetical protein